MKSMTGFGRAEVVTGGWRFGIELASVNRKQSEIVILLPREWQAHELSLRRLVAGRVSRGRVTLSLRIEPARGPHGRLRVDVDLARAYVAALGQVAKVVGSKLAVGASDLLRAPGVFSLEEAVPSSPAVGPALDRCCRRALEGFERSRAAEGRALQKDIEARLRTLRSIHAKILKLAPGVVSRFRETLRRRLAESGLELAPDDDRLAKELAMFADRSDISEELARLSSHLDQCASVVRGEEPAGRPLDFLCQELHRELNTAGAKANDAAVAHLVVAGKTEVEKLREQVQNIE
jgi:uncharacterized protein (TIGR00255 family)